MAGLTVQAPNKKNIRFSHFSHFGIGPCVWRAYRFIVQVPAVDVNSANIKWEFQKVYTAVCNRCRAVALNKFIYSFFPCLFGLWHASLLYKANTAYQLDAQHTHSVDREHRHTHREQRSAEHVFIDCLVSWFIIVAYVRQLAIYSFILICGDETVLGNAELPYANKWSTTPLLKLCDYESLYPFFIQVANGKYVCRIELESYCRMQSMTNCDE